MKIVFFGTPDVSAHHLEALVHSPHDVVAIVTKPDRPKGRSLKLVPPEVKTLRDSRFPQIPLFQPEKCSTPEMIEILRTFDADIFVVVSYGEILSQDILDLPRFGAINVHFSLLPKLRGAAPMQRALMQGEEESGISIIRLVKKMDAGDILSMKKMAIDPDMDCGMLQEALTAIGVQCLLGVLNDFEQGKVVAKAQDHARATFAEKITSEECHIDWKRAAYELHNLIRALSPHPGAWCDVLVRGEKRRLKVFQSELASESTHPHPLIVPCGQGRLSLKVVQLEGKPKMAAEEFVKGIPPSQIIFQS